MGTKKALTEISVRAYFLWSQLDSVVKFKSML